MRSVVVVWMVMAAGLAGSAGAQQPPATPTTSAAAIGVAVPISGEYAALGKQVAQAAGLAADEVGIDLVVADTTATPAGARDAMGRLADNPAVMAVVGPIGEHESRAAAQIAQRRGVPMLTLASVDTVNRVGDWVYRLRQTPAEQAGRLARAVRDQLSGQRRAGILFPESSAGRRAAVSFARRFTAAGGRVTAVAGYAVDTTDFDKVLDELVGRRAHIGAHARLGDARADSDGYVTIRSDETVDFDLLFIPDNHRRVARMLAFFSAAGIQTGARRSEGTAVQMLGLSGWQGPSMRLTGARAAGAIYSDVFVGAADGGRAEDFSRMFEGKTGRKPVNLDAQVFDAVWMLGGILGDQDPVAGDTEVACRRLDVANHLPRSQRVRGVSGELGFGPVGQPRRPIRLYQFDVEGVITPWH